MKKLVLSQIDLDIQEVDLKEVRGGAEIIESGRGRDGRTGLDVMEYIVINDDDSFYQVFQPRE